MQILVTGASGRVGSRLLSELADHGHAIVAWSGKTTGVVAGIELRGSTCATFPPCARRSSSRIRT